MSKNNDSYTFFSVAAYFIAIAILVSVIAGNGTWGDTWWLILLFVALGVGFTGTAINQGGKQPTSASTGLVTAPVVPKTETVAQQEKTPEPKATPATEADDLTRIEGIGPKMNAALIAQGIDTFAKLSTKSVDDIRAAIDAGGMRFAPSAESWAEQAGYAAKGDWDGLAKLQEILESGRYPEGYKK